MLARYQSHLFSLLTGLGIIGVLLVVARRPAGHPIILSDPPTPVPWRIYVVGAVNAPGIQLLPPDSIVQDAITAAGGLTAEADVSTLNLAQLLTDGEQVSVPTRAPSPSPRPPTSTPRPTVTVGPGTPTEAPATAAPPAPTESASVSQPINLNTATAAELDALPGIGPAYAERIIEYRNTHGPFAKPEDIMNVKGIGPATFEKIKAYITV